MQCQRREHGAPDEHLRRDGGDLVIVQREVPEFGQTAKLRGQLCDGVVRRIHLLQLCALAHLRAGVQVDI